MKIPMLAVVLALVIGGFLLYLGPRWLDARVSEARTPSPAQADSLAPDPLVSAAATPPPLARAALSGAPADEGEPQEPVPAEDPVAYAFLPEELEPLSAWIPEHLEEFDAATPAEQLHLGRELLAHSIAVIMCGTGAGPVPRGMPEDGDLSYTGQDGKWSFQINTSTFHFYDHEYPEYAEYMTLLRSAYDDQMVPLETTIELPEDLANQIRRRAREALGWL
jgi:hypothetical protein